MVITAIPAGFAAGLFGIGGGLITVPILFYIFSTSGIEPAYLMHLAVGTSFGIIIPTSIVSVLTHHQHKAVDFKIVKGYGFFVASGVILGTILAASLKTKPLILFFTIVVYFLAFYLGYGHVGLALGSSIAAIVSVVIYYLILSRNSFIEVTKESLISIIKILSAK